MQNLLWSYEWSDGARLELVDSPDDFVLYEYDPDGNIVQVSAPDGYSVSWSDSVSYAKSVWSLEQVIADIEDEYGL